MWICPQCGWMCWDRHRGPDDRPDCPNCGTPAEWDEPAISRLIREGTVGVPRRFGLVRVLGLLVVFALGFGLLRWLNAPPSLFVGVTLSVVLIGLAQALLFGGRKPREASFWAGLFAAPAAVVLIGLFASRIDGRPRPIDPTAVWIYAACLTVLGGPLGYAAGVLVAAVFLVKGRDLEDAQGAPPGSGDEGTE